MNKTFGVGKKKIKIQQSLVCTSVFTLYKLITKKNNNKNKKLALWDSLSFSFVLPFSSFVFPFLFLSPVSLTASHCSLVFVCIFLLFFLSYSRSEVFFFLFSLLA